MKINFYGFLRKTEEMKLTQISKINKLFHKMPGINDFAKTCFNYTYERYILLFISFYPQKWRVLLNKKN